MAGVGSKVVVDMRGFDALVSAAKTRQVALAGVRAGIKVLTPAARAAAPKRSGFLKQAQGYKAAKGRRAKTVAYAVQGARTNVVRKFKGKTVKPSLYDHLVQGGTKPHRLGKGETLGRVLESKSGTRVTPASSQTTGNMHPGARPNPYRKRAAKGKAGAMGGAISGALQKELDKVLGREAARIGAKLRV